MRPNCNTGRKQKSFLLRGTHILVKVHEVGDDFDVGVVDSGLVDDFLQDVAKASGEDEDRHIVLMQAVKELLEAIPEAKNTERDESVRHLFFCCGEQGLRTLRIYIQCSVSSRAWRSGYLSAASDSLTTSDSLSFSSRCSTSSV